MGLTARTWMTRTALTAVFLTVVSISALMEDCFAFVPLPLSRQVYLQKDETSLSRRHLFDFLNQDDKGEKTKGESEVADSDSTQPFSSDDPVEKIFSFFFGQKEESPMGMKRFGRGEFFSRNTGS